MNTLSSGVMRSRITTFPTLDSAFWLVVISIACQLVVVIRVMAFITYYPDDCFQLSGVQIVAFMAQLLGCPAHDELELFIVAGRDFLFKNKYPVFLSNASSRYLTVRYSV